MKLHATILCIAAFMCMMISTSLLHAQGVTTAAINGKVTAQNGEALPGVNVVAVHEPSGTKYGTSTRQDGRYTLPNLRVGGPYTVTASIIGYQKQAATQIYLRLSENLDLNFTMTEEAVQAGEVVVTGERTSVFNSSRTGAATNVTREQIERLPTLTRSFQDYYKTSPFVTGDKGSTAGRNSKYNNIQIDGGDFNDLFGLGGTGTPAGQSATLPGFVNPISLDAVEEFQIVVSPYDIRQGGFTGAGVNAITRSGTNTSQGSIFYYGRNEGFVGKSPDTLKKKYDRFTDWQYGFRVGGPIVENSLFYFLNGEVTRLSFPLNRTFGNQSLGTNAYTVNPDSLALLANYLKSKYGYDVGTWSGFNLKRETEKIFSRLDFNISDKHKVTARWNYLHSVEDNRPSRGGGTTDIYPENGRYQLEDKTHSVTMQLTSIFGNTASNELILGYVNQFDNPYFLGAAFPALYIATRGTNTTSNAQQDLVLGSEEFRHHNELGQKYFEVTDNFSWYFTGHTVTAGAKFDAFKFRNLFIADAFGQYSYSSIARFIADQPPDGNFANSSAYAYRYSATADPLQEANWGATQFAVYAQDEWAVNSALKITAGVRADIPTYPDHPNYNKDIDSTFGYRTDTPPKTSVAFSPRVGLNWSVDEERTTQVRGGIGIFYGRFPFVWVSNQYSNTGVDFYTAASPNFVPTHFYPDPYNQPKPASSALPTAEVDLTDPNFKAPSVIRWNLAIDHKLPFDMVATVEGIFSITQNDVYYQNINLKAVQENSTFVGAGNHVVTRPGGPLSPNGRIVGENREAWGTLDSLASKYSTQWVNNRFSPGVFLVKNTNKGSNANATVQIQRNVREGLNGAVAYTWGVAKDINSGNSTTASSGWRFNPTQGNPNDPQLSYSQWDRRHKITANLTYRQDWGDEIVTTVGLYYAGLSGRPFSYMVAGDVNGDGRSDNDLIYIPKDANDIILTNAGGTVLAKTDPAYSQFLAFIDADSYLKDNKGKISERSGPREPWSHEIDLHVGQEIPTFAGQRIEISFDILNVLNLLKSDWGWVRTTGVNQTVNLLTLKGFVTTPGADYGKPKYNWAVYPITDGKADPFQPDNLLSRWQAQLGFRYSF